MSLDCKTSAANYSRAVSCTKGGVSPDCPGDGRDQCGMEKDKEPEEKGQRKRKNLVKKKKEVLRRFEGQRKKMDWVVRDRKERLSLDARGERGYRETANQTA